MSLCCIVEWSEVEHKKATYSERQSWVSVCWQQVVVGKSVLFYWQTNVEEIYNLVPPYIDIVC